MPMSARGGLPAFAASLVAQRAAGFFDYMGGSSIVQQGQLGHRDDDVRRRVRDQRCRDVGGEPGVPYNRPRVGAVRPRTAQLWISTTPAVALLGYAAWAGDEAWLVLT